MMVWVCFYRSSCPTGGPTRTFFGKDVKKNVKTKMFLVVPLGAWCRQQAKKVSLDENNGLDVIFSGLPARQEVGPTYLSVGLCTKEEKTKKLNYKNFDIGIYSE